MYTVFQLIFSKVTIWQSCLNPTHFFPLKLGSSLLKESLKKSLKPMMLLDFTGMHCVAKAQFYVDIVPEVFWHLKISRNLS